jgi:hypothetical protein
VGHRPPYARAVWKRLELRGPKTDRDPHRHERHPEGHPEDVPHSVDASAAENQVGVTATRSHS